MLKNFSKFLRKNLDLDPFFPVWIQDPDRVRPRERFLDPPYQFCKWPFFLFFSKLVHIFRVRLGHFLGRALRLGQARGPSAAATYLGRALRLAQARGPSAAATWPIILNILPLPPFIKKMYMKLKYQFLKGPLACTSPGARPLAFPSPSTWPPRID